MVQTQQTTGYSFTLPATSNYTARVYPWRNRVPQKALERLERLDAKVSRAVLRGRGGGNTILLPDTTGLAIVNDPSGKVVFAAELTHRGQTIQKSLDHRRAIRRSRRRRHTRYRKPRFDNRGHQDQGWIPPSLESRVCNVLTWVKRLMRVCPIHAISQELVSFDMQAMEHAEISGIEYQQGRLQGYEVRAYRAMRKSLILSEEPQNSSRLVSKPVTNFCVRSW